jgi:SAM-dependent methyltransferase
MTERLFPRVRDSLRLHAQTARAGVQSGALRGAPLLERLLSVPFGDRDAWVDDLLALDGLPPDAPDLPRGSVPYLPCGVDEILAMLRDVPMRPDDDLVDLGSGLGRVVILAHLLTGVRARGVEIQAHLVRSARAAGEGLGIHGVSFVHADAAEAELDGSIFFLYSPFNGQALTAVLRRLEDVAARRAVVVCAVGLELHGLGWLHRRQSAHASLALYDSHVFGVPRRSI